MSAETLQLTRDALARFIETGEVAWAIFDEQLVIEDHDIPGTRDYRGHAGFLKWLSDWSEPWAEWSLEPVQHFDAGDRIVVILRITAKGRSSGIEIDREDSLVYEYRNGKVIRLHYFNTREQGLEAAGLAV